MKGDRLKDKNTVVNNLMYSIAANLHFYVCECYFTISFTNLLGETEYGYWQLYLFYTSYVGFFHFGLVGWHLFKNWWKNFDDLDGHIYKKYNF